MMDDNVIIVEEHVEEQQIDTSLSVDTQDISEPSVATTTEEVQTVTQEADEISIEEGEKTNTEETETANTEETETIESLKNELNLLRSELEEKKKMFDRMSREIGDFSELFPEKNINSIPDSVWDSVKTGIPLAAAYALYERKNALRADVANSINIKNQKNSTGSVGHTNIEFYYTPDEVRAMSRSEVKKNYSKIIESMKKWN